MPDNLDVVDFKDTFLDANHLIECFPGYDVSFMHPSGKTDNCPKPPFRITFPKMTEREDEARKRAHTKEDDTQILYDGGNTQSTSDGSNNRKKIRVESYVPPDRGPYPKDQPKKNSVRFTSVQVEAIISGIQPGLIMVVGPPGAGKTDTAVQILNVLYHNCPNQRSLIITHSNQALNDLFEKMMQRDVPARYLLRLGQGEQELATDMEFSHQDRVNAASD